MAKGLICFFELRWQSIFSDDSFAGLVSLDQLILNHNHIQVARIDHSDSRSADSQPQEGKIDHSEFVSANFKPQLYIYVLRTESHLTLPKQLLHLGVLSSMCLLM
jgi:hypothetical protein